MAIIRDMIPTFDLFQPANVDDALDLLRRHGKDSWVLAGGLDSFDWFKDRIKRPKAVVDLVNVDELRGITADQGGLDIGPMTSLTDVATDARIMSGYSLLSDAARLVATPQIRNQGTLGGNISQDTRCWYYRGGWPCYRAGGNTCYAAAPQAMNREHCLYGANRCVAVNPSDTAPALVALGATMTVRSARKERTYEAEDFFIGPSVDITRMTVMKPGDLLTSIHIPSTWSNATFYFEKVRDRGAWDFALVSVASAMVVNGGTIERARVVVNGVAPFPMRLDRVETAIRGQRITEALEDRAGDLAVQSARPLRHNDYKIAMMRNLVRRAVRGTAA